MALAASQRRDREGRVPTVKTPAMLAQEERRKDYLEGKGDYAPGKRDSKSRAEVVARREARKEAVAARQMYKGANRVARLEERKRGPTMEERMMSQMDPQTAAAYMVGMGRNRAMSSGQEAENDMRRAQAENLRSEAAARDAMLNGRGGPAAGAATGPAGGAVDYNDRLGLAPGHDIPAGLAGKYSGGPIPREDRAALEEWARNTPTDPVSGGMADWTGKSGQNARANALRNAIRNGDWDEANRIVQGANGTPAGPEVTATPEQSAIMNNRRKNWKG